MIKSQLISGDSKIFAFGEDHFYRLADFATLTFIRNSSGRIEGLKWEALTATFMGTDNEFWKKKYELILQIAEPEKAFYQSLTQSIMHGYY
jgi:hypothetical protein